MSKQIHVVGAVIVKDGLVLCTQRGAQGMLAGLWEFPGGKIELGETKERALAREISEELRCDISVGVEVTTTTHCYDFGEVTLTTFYCSLLAGYPTLTEHVAMSWLAPDELESLDWAPADIPAIARIREDLTLGK